MSSILPAGFREVARNLGLDVADDARGFAFNADLSGLVRFLDVGKHIAIAKVAAADSTPGTGGQQSTTHMEAMEGKNMGRDDEIRIIAYRIWEEGNRSHGRNIEHWLKAEAIWERK